MVDGGMDRWDKQEDVYVFVRSLCVFKLDVRDRWNNEWIIGGLTNEWVEVDGG